MVLSMLSTIQAVKLQSAANATPPPPPAAAPPPAEPPSPPDPSASSENLQLPSDMSRRKQKNPKPFFTSSAENEDEAEGALTVAEDNEENRSRGADSTPTSPEPQDLSGMIKVEVREGNFEVNTNSCNASPPMGASPTGARVSPVIAASGPQVSFSPSPPSTSIGLTAGPSLPQLTPMPPLLRAKQASGPSAPHPVPLPPGVPSLPVMEEMMIKNNFFHFGDVSVVNHPDAPPVPMVLPMAYLLPLPSAKDFRYRMFVPMNEPPAIPPPIPHPSLPATPVNGSGPTSPPRKRKNSGNEDTAAPPPSKKDQRPLDLSKGSEDEEEEEEAAAAALVASAAAGAAQKQMQQQIEIEASLNFLKAKQMEMLKQQQVMPPQPQLKLPSAESRCEECNINFSKYQNYVAHKKYYCSASNQKQTKEGDASKSGVQRRNTNSKSPGAMSVNVNAAKNNEGRANSALSSSPSPDSAAAATAAVAAAAAATAALQGILGMGSAETRGAPEAGNFTKEMLLLKQQQEELLLKTVKPPPPHLLLPPPMVPSSSSQPSPTQRTSPLSTSTPGPVSPVTITAGPLPPPLPQSPSAGPLSHFVCDGCGIKFKSVTNLQAHQARYCAGLRNTKPPPPPLGVDEMGAFEAMIKRQSAAAAAAAIAGAAASQPQTQPQPPPPPQLPLSLTSAAEMMSFLNAKSLEQQAKAAAAALQQAAAVSAALSASEQKVKSPPSGASGKNRSGSPSNNPMAPDGFCCILCGYKEQSVERLKDHINMHFIGQVKKSPGGTLSTEHPEVHAARGGRDSASPGSRVNCSPSPNLSGRRRRKSDDENITVSPGPESKRLKMEPAERTPTPTPPPPPPPSSKSPPLLIPSPSATAAALASSPPSSMTATSDPFRCDPCDIGFAHLSNYVAHKKYYCRGKVSEGAKASAAANNGSLVSPKTEK